MKSEKQPPKRQVDAVVRRLLTVKTNVGLFIQHGPFTMPLFADIPFKKLSDSQLIQVIDVWRNIKIMKLRGPHVVKTDAIIGVKILSEVERRWREKISA